MDMYQKRKKRQEMKNSENKKETQNQMNINWLITINLNPYGNYCKIRKNSNLNLAYFC